MKLLYSTKSKTNEDAIMAQMHPHCFSELKWYAYSS